MWKNGFRVSRRPANVWWTDKRRVNRQMDHLLGGTVGPISREYPLLEVWSSDDGLVVNASLAGVDRETLETVIDGQTLAIRGSRPSPELTEGARSYRQERATGQFSRSVALPYDVDVDAVTATYTNGMLRIELPRVPEEKPRKIAIKGV